MPSQQGKCSAVGRITFKSGQFPYFLRRIGTKRLCMGLELPALAHICRAKSHTLRAAQPTRDDGSVTFAANVALASSFSGFQEESPVSPHQKCKFGDNKPDTRQLANISLPGAVTHGVSRTCRDETRSCQPRASRRSRPQPAGWPAPGNFAIAAFGSNILMRRTP